MGASARTLAVFAATMATLSSLITLTAGPALARGAGQALPGVRLTYVRHDQSLSADGTSVSGVACPAGTVPVGGGTAVADPRRERVVQAGFAASAVTRRIDGYQATVQVRGLARGHRVGLAVQVACLPATVLVLYTVHTVLLGGDGTSWWGAPCPSGTAPVGGGTTVADPRAEQVAQAGFHASALTRKMDGYLAMVQVRGLARGHKVGFAVQVACLPTTILVVYAVHTVLLGGDGTSWSGTPCPSGATPAGGGTAEVNPAIENVAGTGFHSTAGRFDGYQATVQVRGLPRRVQLPFAVQVACLTTATAPTYGPPVTVAVSRARAAAITAGGSQRPMPGTTWR
jgi:hypothetical protein